MTHWRFVDPPQIHPRNQSGEEIKAADIARFGGSIGVTTWWGPSALAAAQREVLRALGRERGPLTGDEFVGLAWDPPNGCDS